MNLDSQKRQQLNQVVALNRRVMKTYLLKESLERLWTYCYEGATLRYPRAGSISCDGNGWHLFKTWPTCGWITWTASSTTVAPKYASE